MLLSMLGVSASSKFIKYAAVAVLVFAIGAAVYGFWSHYNSLVAANAELTAQVETLDLVVRTQDDTIAAQEGALDEWKAAQKRTTLELEELRNARLQARREAQRLRKLFSRHDLQALLDARPQSIERLVNSGTADVGRMLECATGAERDDCPNGTGEAGGPAAAEASAD